RHVKGTHPNILLCRCRFPRQLHGGGRMLRVDHYAQIRRAHRDGMSIREIARRFGHSKKTIRKALTQAEPQRYTRHKPHSAPKLDPFKARIDAILTEDEQ